MGEDYLALRLNTPQVDYRIIKFFLPILQKISLLSFSVPSLDRKVIITPFLKLSRIDLPELDKLGERWKIYHVECTGVCGSDKNIARLDQNPETADQYIPNVNPPGFFIALPGYDKIIRPFTLGHEAAVCFDGQKGVLYPIFDCYAKFGDDKEEWCDRCNEGLENICDNTMIGPVRGLALGTGAQAIITRKGRGIPVDIGGGFQEKVFAFDNQFIPTPELENLEQRLLVDSYACAINGVDMVFTGEDNSLRRDESKNIPILIIGMGATGFGVMNYLQQNDFTNITVQTKYQEQSKLVEKHPGNFETISYSSEIKEDHKEKYEIVFDCVGSKESFEQALSYVSLKGHVIDLGLAGIDGRINDVLSSFGIKCVDKQKKYSNNGRTYYTPFWATRPQYKSAIDALRQIPELCRQIVNTDYTLETARQAFFDKKPKFVKRAIKP
jgi:threonine dehydrogenase-like Zn-dependent dehydrogenase